MSPRRPNMTPHKTPMATQPMPQRLDNFQEVALGYTLEQAQAEAERCLKMCIRDRARAQATASSQAGCSMMVQPIRPG